ncbi:MAG: glycoside hydrolase family 2 protein [Pirellulaceae bacterium]
MKHHVTLFTLSALWLAWGTSDAQPAPAPPSVADTADTELGDALSEPAVAQSPPAGGTLPVRFTREFSPMPGLVAEPEKPLRAELCLNGRWQFQPVASPADWQAGKDAPPVLAEPRTEGWDATPIKIPSPWNMNALDSFGASDGADYRSFPSYPAAWEKVELAWLRRTFAVPAAWKGRRLVLHFEAVAGECEVRVNGNLLVRHFDKFLPFEVDVTDAVRSNGPNELLVGIRGTRFFNVPGRFGHFTHPTGAWWTGENGAAGILGIWQDVFLLGLPAMRVRDVFVQPVVDAGELRVQVEVHNETSEARELQLEIRVLPWLPAGEADILTAPEQRGEFGADPVLRFLQPAVLRLEPGERQTVNLAQAVQDELARWTPAQPQLYGVLVEVKSADTVLDRRIERFGWRQFGFQDQRFTLNGELLRLNIELCHFFGTAHLSPRHAWAWYRMLKDCHINAVRLHGAPHPRFYLDLADEMGILVHDETAIYGSHASFNLDLPVTWERFTDETVRLVRRDRNHASVFGWSLENETLAALKIKTGDPQEHAAVGDKFVPIIELVRSLDPTRPWISADGDSDWGGRFPVALAHYGPGVEHYRAHEQTGKPWGVTESTYLWGSMPPEVSRWNGERAYESWSGRVEGMALDVWNELVEKQIQPFPHISVVSVYDVTYYGCWPQPFGLSDLTRPLTLQDGVHFTAPFVEGKPGIQPERLGPYATMLNPGYDPSLPMYQPSPVFHAARAAYAPGGPTPYLPPLRKEEPAVPAAALPEPTIERVGMLGGPEGVLARTLAHCGVPLEFVRDHTAYPLLVVDAATFADVAQTQSHIESTLAADGTVLVWGVQPENAGRVSTLLPAAVETCERRATSLLPTWSHALSAVLLPSQCYFTETNDGQAMMRYGLTGPLVRQSQLVLRAAEVNWEVWRNRQEPLKVAATIRSEREAKSSAALIEHRGVMGRLLVSSLEATAPTSKHRDFFRALMRGLGVKLLDPKPPAGGIFNEQGFVTKALVIGPFTTADYEQALDNDFVGGETEATPQAGDKAGDKAGDQTWQEMAAGADAVFSFNAIARDADARNHVAYVSFWLFSSRADDLLDDARGAKVDLIAGSDDGAKFWLNGRLIHENRGKNPLQPEQYQLTRLSLRKGWNRFLVKVVNDYGNWQFKARLQCSDPSLAPLLQSALAAPTQP